ncbi:MAG: hypothetical protein ACJ75A_13105 [Actinomycetes bacterium]
MDRPGRACPLGYRYRPEALAQPARLEADTFYVVGGLYGNPAALAAVLERAAEEPAGPATIVFNGDTHWLDVDPGDFQAIGETVLAHHATRGNVEAELASEGPGEDGGCGCAYPDHVADDVVDRSNQIITRLRATATRFPGLVRRRAVGGVRCDALPVRFDLSWWTRRLLAQWPPGSPGHRSSFTRLTGGTHLHPHQAARDGVQLASRDGTGP